MDQTHATVLIIFDKINSFGFANLGIDSDILHSCSSIKTNDSVFNYLTRGNRLLCNELSQSAFSATVVEITSLVTRDTVLRFDDGWELVLHHVMVKHNFI